MGATHIGACSLALLRKFRRQIHLFGKLIAEDLGEAGVLVLIRINLAPVVAPLALLGVGVHLKGNSAANDIASPASLFVQHVVPLSVPVGRCPGLMAACALKPDLHRDASATFGLESLELIDKLVTIEGLDSGVSVTSNCLLEILVDEVDEILSRVYHLLIRLYRETISLQIEQKSCFALLIRQGV